MTRLGTYGVSHDRGSAAGSVAAPYAAASAAKEARWTGCLAMVAGAVFELFGASKNSTGLAVVAAGGLIVILCQSILLVLRHRHPEDDPSELVVTVNPLRLAAASGMT